MEDTRTLDPVGETDLPYVIRWYDDKLMPAHEVHCAICNGVLGNTEGPELRLNRAGGEDPVDVLCGVEVDGELAAAIGRFYAELNLLRENPHLSTVQRDGVLDLARQAAHIGYEPLLGLTKFDIEVAAGFIALYRSFEPATNR
jgi:hypothetical protein